MIVDPSVIAAILLREPEGEHFRTVLEKHGALMSALSYLELAIVLASKGVSNAGPTLDAVLSGLGVDVVPFTPHQARLAQEAHQRFGRGSGHPAKLNFGDCITYALAKDLGEALLYKGDDFGHTDLQFAP